MSAVRPETIRLPLIDADDGSGMVRMALVRVDAVQAVLHSDAGCILQIGGRLWICTTHTSMSMPSALGWE